MPGIPSNVNSVSSNSSSLFALISPRYIVLEHIGASNSTSAVVTCGCAARNLIFRRKYDSKRSRERLLTGFKPVNYRAPDPLSVINRPATQNRFLSQPYRICQRPSSSAGRSPVLPCRLAERQPFVNNTRTWLSLRSVHSSRRTLWEISILGQAVAECHQHPQECIPASRSTQQ